MRYFILFIILISTSFLFSWEKTINYGLSSLNKTTDNGNITCENGANLGWYAKFDQDGNEVFSNYFGWNYANGAYYALQADDGGYYICGMKTKYYYQSPTYFYWQSVSVLLKLNASGSIVWEKHHAEDISDYYTPFAGIRKMVKKDYADYFLIGNLGYDYYYTYSGIYLALIDKDGNEKDYSYIKNSFDIYAYSGDLTTDGGMIIGGFKSYSNETCFFMKVDNSLNQVWTKSDNPGVIYGVKSTEGNYLLCGNINSDAMYAKIDDNGNYIWAKRFTGSNVEYFKDILVESDGYVFCGATTSYGAGGYDILLLKSDKNGNVLWTDYVGATNNERGNVIVPDGNYYLVGGNKDSNGYMIQVEREQTKFIRVVAPNGGENWQTGSQQLVQWDCPDNGRIIVFYSSNGRNGNYKEIFRGNATTKNFTWTIPDDQSENCYLKGYWADYEYREDTSDAAFTIYDNTGFKENETANKIPSKHFSASPNPFASHLSIFSTSPTSIYSLTGQLILNLSKGKHSLDTSKWREGVYIVKSGMECKRLVKVK